MDAKQCVPSSVCQAVCVDVGRLATLTALATLTTLEANLPVVHSLHLNHHLLYH
jgi:hypothetical protein